MRNYVLSVITVAFCGCIAKMFLPEGEEKSIKKAFSLIVSLLLIVSVAKPAISFMNSADSYDIGKAVSGAYASSVENYSAKWQETLGEVTSDGLKDYISELLTENFGLSEENFLLECNAIHKGDEIKVEKIEITLIGAGVFTNPRKIESYVEGLGFECNVTEKWGEKNGK